MKFSKQNRKLKRQHNNNKKTHDKKRDQPKNNYVSLDFNKEFLTKNMLLHI